mgnify:CR=1 FL=1
MCAPQILHTIVGLTEIFLFICHLKRFRKYHLKTHILVLGIARRVYIFEKSRLHDLFYPFFLTFDAKKITFLGSSCKMRHCTLSCAVKTWQIARGILQVAALQAVARRGGRAQRRAGAGTAARASASRSDAFSSSSDVFFVGLTGSGFTDAGFIGALFLPPPSGMPLRPCMPALTSPLAKWLAAPTASPKHVSYARSRAGFSLP